MSGAEENTSHGRQSEAEEDGALRIEALFHWATNTGSAYPSFLRAVRGGYRGPWWADAADRLARDFWNDQMKGAAPPPWTSAPTPAEVLACALSLEAYYRQHVAEFDPRPQEQPSA